MVSKFKILALVVVISLFILLFISCKDKTVSQTENKNDETNITMNETKIIYPETKVDNVKENLHGVEITDPYRWLENSESPDVKQWTEKENELSTKYIHNIKNRKQIRERIEKLWNYPKMSVPNIDSKLYFYKYNDGLQDQDVLYVKDTLDGEAKVVIDPNKLSKDKTTSLDYWYPSENGKYLAYGLSESGNEKSILYIKDLDTNKDLNDKILGAYYTGISWDKDSNGFYYSRFPEAGTVSANEEFYNNKLYHHTIGDDYKNDELIMEDTKNKETRFYSGYSNDYRYLIVHAYLGSSRKNDVYIKDLKNTNVGFIQIAKDFQNAYSVQILDDIIYIHTNENAPNYKIMTTDIKNSLKENWKDLIPVSNDMLEDYYIVNKQLVVKYLHNAYSVVKLFDLSGKEIETLEFPTIGETPSISGKWDKDEMFISFTSFTFPTVIYRYTLSDKKMTEYFKTKIDFDTNAYEVKQVWFESKDKTKVSMFIMHKKGLEYNGKNPLLLYGYGGFSINLTPSFSATRIIWMEKGGIYAMVNLRGGGEYGETWHNDGKLDKKQNSFDDFISAAEWLITNKYTNKDKLAIVGGSNGGLLVGAVVVQRPDLFKVAACLVPLIDMLRYDKFLMAKYWVPEYGTAENAEQFKYLYKYSPYQNVKEGVEYPAMYISSAESDSRVHPLHARKFAALLQKMQKGNAPILLYVETKAGHGPGKPISKSMEEVSDIYSFLGKEVGLWD